MGKTTSTAAQKNIYSLDGKIPYSQAIPLGLQHVLAMFVANIAPIFIVAAASNLKETDIVFLIQTAMIFAGIGTFIQLYPVWKLGAKMPIVTGISFTFVAVFCEIGITYGYSYILGAVLLGGILQFLLGLTAKYWIKLISPITSACVVTAIGISLLPVGAQTFGGGASSADFGSLENLFLGTTTLVLCLLFQIILKPNLKQLSVLFGLIVGYIIAILIGKVDFTALKSLSLLSFPHYMPFTLEFRAEAIYPVLLLFLVSSTETIGDVSALAQVGFNRSATLKEKSGALACDGLVSSLSSLFGCLPITSFSQNVGLVAMTKVVNRKAISMGAVIMLIAGLIPLCGGLLTTLPEAVLGGAVIMMFGNIMICGFRMISTCGFTDRNITICALSLAIGIGFTQEANLLIHLPEMLRSIVGNNCVVATFIVSVILDLTLPQKETK